jgi:HEXXH motif-containing protein
MEKYSPEILEDFHNTVRNIVLIPDAGSSKNTSYTCRLSYFGGIFVNPFGIDAYQLVESLIHEYYHQRLWQWWSYEDIDGLPPFEVCITSPMTGLSRPVSVMLQAFAIYISVLHFYCHAHNNFPPTTASILESLNKRVEHIRQGIPPLYERLKGSINSTTIASSMIDFLFDEFSKIPA